jgi:hypothetical protein
MPSPLLLHAAAPIAVPYPLDEDRQRAGLAWTEPVPFSNGANIRPDVWRCSVGVHVAQS